ncbi:LacI family DNA-binding transcriptional regulator [Pseudoduganella sp. UC29_106]|uniref:LacI family DNA-binding transcriptional regulator n=1 Tax=Pseudoduganella sp. UC29_106 TaxID=3374553 RepID=UPI0037568C3E
MEAKIEQSIKQLGYRSNPMAQSMITGKTKTVGLAVLDIANPHFSSIVKGANRVAQAHGYTLLLVDTEENPAASAKLLEALEPPRGRHDHLHAYAGKRNGLAGGAGSSARHLQASWNTSSCLPSPATISRGGSWQHATWSRKAGTSALPIWVSPRSRRDAERMGRRRDCLLAHGMELAVLEAAQPSAAEGERLCSTIMLGAEHPDALICCNDLMALGFMKAAQTLGFRLPADISVAGFDNIQYGDLHLTRTDFGRPAK